MAQGHSVRSFLLIDILLDNFQRCSTARSREVAPAPEHVLPIPLLKRWELLPKEPAGDAFQAVHQRRQGNFRREIHQQMHVIRFPVELSQFGAGGFTNAGEYIAHCFDVNAVKDAPPILRRKDQMSVQQKDAMASRSVFSSGFQRSLRAMA